jgi:Uma2 family endonuclease
MLAKSIVYETLNQIPIYYRRMNLMVKGESTVGCSGIQAMIISVILRYLYQHLPAQYEIVTNEVGLHIDKNNNLAADIAIYEKSHLNTQTLNEQYLTIPPCIIIEVDTKADVQDFQMALDYYTLKTKKLLTFGVNKVIWLSSGSRTILVAKADENWIIHDWNQPVILVDNIELSMEVLMQAWGL